jgi:hypothetical protein
MHTKATPEPSGLLVPGVIPEPVRDQVDRASAPAAATTKGR